MKKTISDWKRWINHQAGINWQKGFFDHRLRDESDLIEKRNYILNNPVRAGLVESTNAWPYIYDAFPTNPPR